MTAQEKGRFLQQKAQEHRPDLNDKVLWSVHALKKLRIERLRKDDLENALRDGIIIEDYPMESRPLPGCLVLGFVGNEPVHIVLAVDVLLDRLFIITVYRPSVERWEDDWKRRKKSSE